MKKLFMFLFISASLLIISCKEESTNTLSPSVIKTGTITGLVTDNLHGYAITAVTVSVSNSAITAQTDSLGNFILNNVPFGDHQLSFEHTLYSSVNISVTLKDTMLQLALVELQLKSYEYEVISFDSLPHGRIQQDSSYFFREFFEALYPARIFFHEYGTQTWNKLIVDRFIDSLITSYLSAGVIIDTLWYQSYASHCGNLTINTFPTFVIRVKNNHPSIRTFGFMNINDSIFGFLFLCSSSDVHFRRYRTFE